MLIHDSAALPELPAHLTSVVQALRLVMRVTGGTGGRKTCPPLTTRSIILYRNGVCSEKNNYGSPPLRFSAPLPVLQKKSA